MREFPGCAARLASCGQRLAARPLPPALVAPCRLAGRGVQSAVWLSHIDSPSCLPRTFSSCAPCPGCAPCSVCGPAGFCGQPDSNNLQAQYGLLGLAAGLELPDHCSICTQAVTGEGCLQLCKAVGHVPCVDGWGGCSWHRCAPMWAMHLALQGVWHSWRHESDQKILPTRLQQPAWPLKPACYPYTPLHPSIYHPPCAALPALVAQALGMTVLLKSPQLTKQSFKSACTASIDSLLCLALRPGANSSVEVAGVACPALRVGLLGLFQALALCILTGLLRTLCCAAPQQLCCRASSNPCESQPCQPGNFAQPAAGTRGSYKYCGTQGRFTSPPSLVSSPWGPHPFSSLPPLHPHLPSLALLHVQRTLDLVPGIFSADLLG